MPTPRPETDFARAAELRQWASKARSPKAKETLVKSANRLEDRGARNASKLGRKRRSPANRSIR